MNTIPQDAFPQDSFLLTLTNDQRPYFALDPIDPQWIQIPFYHHESGYHTRTTMFFRDNTIVKVIYETSIKDPRSNPIETTYQEYDTCLATEHRAILLPLTARGKPKKLTASAIDHIMPFGCRLYIRIRHSSSLQKASAMLLLSNPRANRRFPIGLWDRVNTISSDADFRSFVADYIATCRDDYWNKLHDFRSANKMTVKYKAGDIFRMDYDRTRYCYGIITTDVKKLQRSPLLPEEHSFRHLMGVPLLVRIYQTITDNPDLKAEDLAGIPLGPAVACMDNDIIWGTHPIVDHKPLDPEDLYFKLVCTIDRPYVNRHYITEESVLHIEWGFAKTSLPYCQMSPKLKENIDHFHKFSGGVSTGLYPEDLFNEDRDAHWYHYMEDLLNPHCQELKAEVFACLGLDTDASFDAFAARFGGLSREEILKLGNQRK